jgi:1-acyl-sn-glycerol-3-phosphate acyltransferase
MSWFRLLARLVSFITCLLLTAAVAGLLILVETVSRRSISRPPWARACFHMAARCSGFRMSRRGDIARGPVLFVSNHISWSDIPVLGGMAPLRFLSKQEVRRWPLIGWLAAQAGTLFIRRGGGTANKARDEIANSLKRGESVLVFPEGTTSAGIGVLPFHGKLLKAAIDAGVPIQPISIGYLRDGRPDPVAPFIGDDEFQSHLVRMLKRPATRVEVHFHPAVTPGQDESLASLAERLRDVVARGLKDIQSPDTRAEGALTRGPEFS